MSYVQSRFSALLILMLLVPLIAACGSAPTADPGPTSAAPAPTTIPDPATPADTPELPLAPTSGSSDAPTAEPTALSLNPDYLQFGVVAHLYYTDRERVLQLTRNAGFDWVRQQIYWRDIEDPVNGIWAWDEIDPIVATANAYGVRLLVNVVRSPTAYSATNG
ncbi:MAG: hypothetical protein EOM24_15725, partial [Chloroflexia bacterium]|nr:hypothetical protein [Chloroflexia bacterium]